MTSGARLPLPEVIARLATGGGGPQACEELSTGQYGKHALLLLGLVRAARERRHPDAEFAGTAYDLLATLERTDPGAVRAVVRQPAVGAWAIRMLRALSDNGATDLRWFASVAAAAAVRSGGTHTVRVPVVGDTVVLPSLGAAVLAGAQQTRPEPGDALGHGDGGMAVLRCSGGAGEVRSGDRRARVPADPRQGLAGWRPLPRIAAAAAGLTLELTIDDCDPYRMPATANVAPPLDAEEIERWRESARLAWTVLVLRHRPVAEEIAVALRVLTPLAAPATGQVSASSPDAPGTVAMSAPPDATMFALTLAHEVQHFKLAALLDLVELTRPDDGSRYYAAWRDDPRPARALLHGSYAHLGVAGFWRRHRRHEHGQAAVRAHAEFARWLAASQGAARVLLDSGRLTAAGRAFVAGMAATLRGWADEPVPEQARAMAHRIAQEHVLRWQERNGANPHVRSAPRGGAGADRPAGES